MDLDADEPFDLRHRAGLAAARTIGRRWLVRRPDLVLPDGRSAGGDRDDAGDVRTAQPDRDGIPTRALPDRGAALVSSSRPSRRPRASASCSRRSCRRSVSSGTGEPGPARPLQPRLLGQVRAALEDRGDDAGSRAARRARRRRRAAHGRRQDPGRPERPALPTPDARRRSAASPGVIWHRRSARELEAIGDRRVMRRRPQLAGPASSTQAWSCRRRSSSTGRRSAGRAQPDADARGPARRRLPAVRRYGGRPGRCHRGVDRRGDLPPRARSAVGWPRDGFTEERAAERVRHLLDALYPNAPALAGRTRPLRIVVASHDLKFFSRLLDHFQSLPELEVRVDAVAGARSRTTPSRAASSPTGPTSSSASGAARTPSGTAKHKPPGPAAVRPAAPLRAVPRLAGAARHRQRRPGSSASARPTRS